MESVSKFFKEEDDFLYKKGDARGGARGKAQGEVIGKVVGEAIGKEKQQIETITDLIVKLGFSDEQIVKTFNFPLALVKRVRENLK